MYDTLGRLMTKEYDAGKEKYVPRRLPLGAPYPRLAPLAKVKANEEAVMAALGLESGDNGTYSQVGLMKLIHHKAPLLFPTRRLPPSCIICKAVVVNIQADGAGIYRNIKVVNFGMTLVKRTADDEDEEEPSCAAASRKMWDTALLMTARDGDDHVNVKRLLAHGLGQTIADICENGIIVIDGVDYSCTVVFTADLMALNSCCGLNTSAAQNPCVWCDAERSNAQFALPGLEAELRTVPAMTEDAHLWHADMSFPWTCKRCNKTFLTLEALESEPAPATKQQLAQYMQRHCSQRFKTEVLMAMPMTHRIPDVLHFLLRCVQDLFAGTITAHLDERSEKAVNEVLRELGVHLKTARVTKNTNATQGAVRPGLIGRECKTVLEAPNYKRLLTSVCYYAGQHAVGSRQQRLEHAQLKALGLAAWAALAATYTELSCTWPEDTRAERERR